MDAVEPLARMLADDGLKPVAVVLTHGHLDHTFSVLPVCDGYGIPAYLHPDDFGMLSDPARWHGPQLAPLISGVAAARPLRREAAGRRRGAVAGRGGAHRPARARPHRGLGRVLPRPGRGARACSPATCCSPGSVGRVDLPGGSWDAMLRSLRDVVLPLDDETVVLPGHGPATTIGRERATNPYLAEAAAGAGRRRRGRGL